MSISDGLWPVEPDATLCCVARVAGLTRSHLERGLNAGLPDEKSKENPKEVTKHQAA